MSGCLTTIPIEYSLLEILCWRFSAVACGQMGPLQNPGSSRGPQSQTKPSQTPTTETSMAESPSDGCQPDDALTADTPPKAPADCLAEPRSGTWLAEQADCQRPVIPELVLPGRLTAEDCGWMALLHGHDGLGLLLAWVGLFVALGSLLQGLASLPASWQWGLSAVVVAGGSMLALAIHRATSQTLVGWWLWLQGGFWLKVQCRWISPRAIILTAGEASSDDPHAFEASQSGKNTVTRPWGRYQGCRISQQVVLLYHNDDQIDPFPRRMFPDDKSWLDFVTAIKRILPPL